MDKETLPPYGFEVDEERVLCYHLMCVEIAILKRIKEGLYRGRSFKSIAASLNRATAGFLTREGTKWTGEKVKEVLLEYTIFSKLWSTVDGERPPWVQETLNGKRRTWTEEELREVVALRENGLSFDELAGYYSVKVPSARALYQRAKKAIS